MKFNKHQYCQKLNIIGDQALSVENEKSNNNLKGCLVQLSWTDIKLFMECQRCFFRYKILNKKRPGIDSESFAMYKSVDQALKNELDFYRNRQVPHPIMINNNIVAIPLKHHKINEWRGDYYSKVKGIYYFDECKSLTLQGCIDDVWVNFDGEIHLVEYKVTSQPGDLFFKTNKWSNVYKQQLAYYMWLFKKNGYNVSKKGYVVCCFFNKNQASFNNQLVSQTSLVEVDCDDSWIEETLLSLVECLNNKLEPIATAECEYCVNLK